jgi:hypothetical protein
MGTAYAPSASAAAPVRLMELARLAALNVRGECLSDLLAPCGPGSFSRPRSRQPSSGSGPLPVADVTDGSSALPAMAAGSPGQEMESGPGKSLVAGPGLFLGKLKISPVASLRVSRTVLGVHRFARETGAGPGLKWRGVVRPFCMAKSLEGRRLRTACTGREGEPGGNTPPGRDVGMGSRFLRASV